MTYNQFDLRRANQYTVLYDRYGLSTHWPLHLQRIYYAVCCVWFRNLATKKPASVAVCRTLFRFENTLC